MEELRRINRLTSASYDLAAEKYHDLFRDELDRKPYDRKLLDRFATYFEPGASIHDLGCGPSGHIGHYLHAKGLHVVASDISPRCIALASGYHPDMAFFVMDMADLALKDQSIEGIVSYYSMIHTPKRLVFRLFQEIHRVLKPRGKLLLSVKEGGGEGFLEAFLGFETRIFFESFNMEEIGRFLAGSGFGTLSLDRRSPLAGEIPVPRIFAIGEKI